MVCDDDHAILEVVELMLEIDGYDVIKVDDSTKLLEKLRTDCPDLLLLDLWMPVISGEQILKSLRSDDSLKNLPVVMFSASLDGASIAEQADANAFLPKPFDMEKLSSIVNQVLG